MAQNVIVMVAAGRAWLVCCNLAGCTAGAMSHTLHKCDLGQDAWIMGIEYVAWDTGAHVMILRGGGQGCSQASA
jgi:hypothetical protein